MNDTPRACCKGKKAKNKKPLNYGSLRTIALGGPHDAALSSLPDRVFLTDNLSPVQGKVTENSIMRAVPRDFYRCRLCQK